MNKFTHGCSRRELRQRFQPSRVVLGVVRDGSLDRYNVITLAFNMWSSYSPLSMAVAVEHRNYSSALFEREGEFSLAIPGERMVREVLFCGTHSGRDRDKARECGFDWVPSDQIATPGIQQAIANLEMRTVERIPSGDHRIILAEVVSIAIAEGTEERQLLSIGPATRGFKVLARAGQHTLGVVLDATLQEG
jgi:flavin reductase (DIM6/NTAB) family NADH-FMN oxidoreductase RutF